MKSISSKSSNLSNRKPASRAMKLAALAISLLIVLPLAEYFVRLYVNHLGMEKIIFSCYENIFHWELEPHQNVLRKGPNWLTPSPSYRIITNAHGFRGPGLMDDPEYRILCIGDSETFGQGVEHYEAWPAVLQDILRKQTGFKRLEAINAGGTGYSTAQKYVTMARHLKQLNSDIVVYQLHNNDHGPPLAIRHRLPGEFIHYNSFLLVLTRIAFFSVKDYADHATYDWSHSFEMLGRISRLIEANQHITFYFFQPFSIPAEFRARVDHIVEGRCNAKIIDCAGIIDDSKYIIPGDGHANAEGHRIMAEKLANVLASVLANDLLSDD